MDVQRHEEGLKYKKQKVSHTITLTHTQTLTGSCAGSLSGVRGSSRHVATLLTILERRIQVPEQEVRG